MKYHDEETFLPPLFFSLLLALPFVAGEVDG